MKKINGYRLEAIARQESPGSEHYWPAVRVTRIGGQFSATHTLGGMSFDSRKPESALLAAQRGIANINRVSRTHA